MKNYNSNFLGFIYIVSQVLLGASFVSCSSSTYDEPSMITGTSETELEKIGTPYKATILVLHNNPDYGRPINNSSLTCKVFLNSEDNIDKLLDTNGYLSCFDSHDIFISSDLTNNVKKMPFMGKEYFCFNSIEFDISESEECLISGNTEAGPKYVTLLYDYKTFGTCHYNDEALDEEFYLFTNLPIPVENLRRNKIYIFILNDTFNFFEHIKVAGECPLIYDKADYDFRKNSRNDYQLFEYSLSDKTINQL